jgi:4a-hydroxytetrahydrobiopterin dehydratase
MTLSAHDVAGQLPEGWTFGDDALHATYRTGSFVAGVAFVQAIADRAEAANHHPDLTLTYPEVGVTLSSHDAGGVTDRDVRLAAEISEAAQSGGYASAPA